MVLSNSPMAIARKFKLTKLGIEQQMNANKIKNDIIAPKFEIPECVKQQLKDDFIK